MFDKELIIDVIVTIEGVLETVQRRTRSVASVDDFLNSDSGMVLLESVCMNLVAVGESLKNIDKITNRELLCNYDDINWKDAMGMRDIIVHHYFDIDVDQIFSTLKRDIPQLLTALRKIRKELE